MAWQVYDFMEGRDGNSRYPSRMPKIYGPLAVKRWIRAKGDKRHRMSYRAPTRVYVDNSPRDDVSKARQAVEYAVWLARRDGLDIPANAAPRVAYHVFPSAYQRSVSGKPAIIKHAMCVIWRVGNDDVAQMPIPHCGWEPAPAAEEIEAEEFQLAAF